MKSIHEMKVLYNRAKNGSIGDIIICPFCGKPHTKTTYHKIFCSNAKTRVRRNCKDMFWNNIDPEKRCRNTPYFHDVICGGDNDYVTVDEIHDNMHPYEGLNDEAYKVH